MNGAHGPDEGLFGPAKTLGFLEVFWNVRLGLRRCGRVRWCWYLVLWLVCLLAGICTVLVVVDLFAGVC